MVNESGSENGTKNETPENKITLVQLLLNLANSGNEKHAKLASDLLDLNLIQGNDSDLGLNGSDKNEQELTIDNNTETDMEWTNSNDSEKIKLDITVSPSKNKNLTIKTSKLPEMEIMTIIESKVKVNQAKMLEQNRELGIGTQSIRIQY